MPERQSIAQVVQIGKEATNGTAVAATKRLGSMLMSPAVEADTSLFRPSGLKFPTVQALNKEMATWDVEGQPTFEEIIIPLASVIGAPTVAQVMDGGTPTGAYNWTFTPSETGPESPYTYTAEKGALGVAEGEQFAHLLFTAFGLDISRDEISLSAEAFSRAATLAFTPTAALAVPTTLRPILPSQFSAYLDTTAAGLGTTRLTRLISANPSVGGRYNPAWFVDASQASFTTFVEDGDGPDATNEVVIESNTTEGNPMISRLRDGATRFLRLEALGDVVYNAGVQPNLKLMFRWDMAVKVENVDAWSDEDGIYALPITLRPVYDPTWAKTMQITVRNQTASL